MKRSKFSEAQIAFAFILRQGDEGTPVGEVCRKAGISEATYYNWRKKYGGLLPRYTGYTCSITRIIAFFSSRKSRSSSGRCECRRCRSPCRR